jgi:hypothetical protein
LPQAPPADASINRVIEKVTTSVVAMPECRGDCLDLQFKIMHTSRVLGITYHGSDAAL